MPTLLSYQSVFHSLYNENHKNTKDFCDNLGKHETNFKSLLTIALSDKLRKKLLFNLVPSLKSVAALTILKTSSQLYPHLQL